MHRILDGWRKKALKRGAKIRFGAAFRDHSLKGGLVRVETSKGDFFCRLLVDASGFSSIIAKKNTLANGALYWSCFGCKAAGLKNFDSDTTVIIENLVDGDPLPFWMIFPIGKTKSVPIVFYLGKKPVSKAKMARGFEKHIRLPQYARVFKGHRVIEEKIGWIPLWAPKTAFERVALVGDAGGWAPALCGTGFNAILSRYEQVSENLEKLLEKNDLSEESISKALSPCEHETDSQALQSALSLVISKCDSQTFEKLIASAKSVEPEILARLVEMRQSHSDVVGIANALAEKLPAGELAKKLSVPELVLAVQKLGAVIGHSFVSKSHAQLHEKGAKRCALCGACDCEDCKCVSKK